MVQVVVMPQLGNTVESCLITTWLVTVGDFSPDSIALSFFSVVDGLGPEGAQPGEWRDRTIPDEPRLQTNARGTVAAKHRLLNLSGRK